MFGDLMGMMGKIKETQKKVEATKERLNTVMIDETSSDGLLKVTLTANREIKSISIDDSLLEDKEQLEDYLVLTLNKAIEKATKVNEAELAAVTVPTLLINGDEDEPCLDAKLWLKRTMPASGLVILPRTGHASNLEEPDAFNHAAQEFFSTAEQGRWAARDPRSIAETQIVHQEES